MSHPAPSASPAALALLCTVILCIGAGTAAQSTINARVGHWSGLGMFASSLNLSMGSILLTIAAAAEVAAARPPGSMRFLAWSSRPPLALLAPGVCGVAFVSAGVFFVPILGAALFFVLIVVGQLLTAAAFDATGFGGIARIPLSAPRAVALLAALAGAGMTVAERAAVSGGASPAVDAAAALATVAVGAAMVLQANLSRRAAALLPSRLAAVWWSFAVSTLCALCVLGAQAGADSEGLAQLCSPATWATVQWWYFAAAPLGVAYIASSIILIPRTGAALYFVCLVAGQLVGSATIDATGALNSPRTPITPLRGAGIAVVIVAAAGTQAPPALWAALCPCARGGRGGGKAVEALLADTEGGGAEGSEVELRADRD